MAKAALAEQNTSLEKAKAPIARLNTFLGEVRSEMRKVATPSPSETRTTTAVVIVTVFAFAAFFWLVDFGINNSVNRLLTWLTQH